MAIGGGAEGGGDDGWRGGSVTRVRLLQGVMSSSLKADKLRVFVEVLCRLRMASATHSLPELLNVVLEETGIQK